MKPSITDILSELGITNRAAQRLKDDTRSFLMRQNDNNNEKVSRLRTQTLEQHARDFLAWRGKKYFSSSQDGGLIWPGDSDTLVDGIRRVMYNQKMSKYYHMKERQALRLDARSTISVGSDSDVSQRHRSGKKRPLTEIDEPWSPGGAQGDSPAPRLCVTRSATQPGMPMIQSIEDSGDKELRVQSTHKRPRVEQKHGNDQCQGVNATFDACGRQYTPKTGADQALKRTIDIGVPLPEVDRQQAVVTMSAAAEIQPSSAHLESLQTLAAAETRGKRQPISLTGFRKIDEFIIENNLHLSATPEVSEIPIVIAESPRCEPTPPATSSFKQEPFEIYRQLFSMDRSLPSHIVTSALGEDFKMSPGYLSPEFHENAGVVDLTGPDLVEIQTGDNNFRMIDKERAPRVLQKLIDIFVDELRICRRNARQAPIGQQKRTWEIKTAHLENLLGRAHGDEQLWKGGCLDDRAVEML